MGVCTLLIIIDGRKENVLAWERQIPARGLAYSQKVV